MSNAVAKADNTRDDIDLSGFYTQPKAELDTPMTFDDALRAVGELTEAEYAFVSSPYAVLKGAEKDKLIGVPFMVRAWRFNRDQDTDNPYVILYLITRDNEAYIITDGSSGIYEQMNTLTEDRLAKGHPTPVEHLLVANGLRSSVYNLTDVDGAIRPAKPGEKVSGKATTYYLA